VRYTAKPVRPSSPVETFTIQFANITPASTDLQIMWENTMVTLPITAETDKKIMAQIDNLLNKDTRPYLTAAMYYVDNNKDLNQAVAWFDKTIEQNPKSFNAYYQKANALVKLGKKDEARKAANRSLELARDAKNENSIRLNEKLLADLK
jgi:tetratricopeptide (TPR) repeat protein